MCIEDHLPSTDTLISFHINIYLCQVSHWKGEEVGPLHTEVSVGEGGKKERGKSLLTPIPRRGKGRLTTVTLAGGREIPLGDRMTSCVSLQPTPLLIFERGTLPGGNLCTWLPFPSPLSPRKKKGRDVHSWTTKLREEGEEPTNLSSTLFLPLLLLPFCRLTRSGSGNRQRHYFKRTCRGESNTAMICDL